MNKGLHRIIFSKKHGTMVAVAETANSRGKGRQAGSSAPLAAGVSDGLCFKLKTALKTMVCTLVSASMILPAHAQITVDKTAPKNQQAVILKTNTGAPLVNIQTPNARGLSHNRYTQFDVDTKGAVLNNDRSGNPFLAKGSAQLILNEVRGAASKLNGIITVGGQKADVIIANPNGITVNGGGFKNAGRGILTTGTPQIGKDGALTGFDVRQGTLTVGAAGWNDKGGADYTEVLARAVALQGKLQGKNLAVSTGAQKVDYASGEISAGTVAGTKPAVAVDTAALGGMYADSITLIANEKGVGVKNAGTLEATKQLIITSSGRIENSGRIATTADSTTASPTYLSIETTEKGAAGAFVSNGGRIESKGLMVIDTGEDIGLRKGAVVQNSGSRPSATVLNAGRNLVIDGKSNVNNTKGATYLTAEGRSIVNDAQIQTGTSLHSSSTGNTELGNNTRITGENVTVLSNGSIISSAAIEAKDTAHIEAGKPLSVQETTVASDIRLNGGNVKAGKNVVLMADNNVGAKTSQLITAGNLYTHAGKDLNLNTDKDVSASNISLKSGGVANISGSSKTLAATGNIEAEAGTLQVTATNLNAGNLQLKALKNGMTIRNAKLNAAQNIDVAALTGSIVAEGLNAAATGGRVSVLAEGNADFNGTNTLTATSDVNAGSVGKGRLKADNTNISSSAGNVTLVSRNGMQLGDGKQRNSISGKHINIQNNGGSAGLKNLNVHAKNGALNIHSDRALSIENAKLESTHNMQINAQNERITLNQVDAYAHRHMNITAQGKHSGQIWQNDKLPSANILVANGVLALNSRYSQIADNTTLRAGAINLTAGTDLIKRGNINWSTIATKTLEDNEELKPFAGMMSIESGGNNQLTVEPGNRIVSAGDMILKHNGKFKISARAGNNGNPSAQTASVSAKGNIGIVAEEVNIDGANLSAGKDLTLVTTKGNVEVKSIRNTFTGYISNDRVIQLRKKLDDTAQELALLKAKQAAWEKTPEFAAWNNMLIDILEWARLDPGYTAPIDMIATIEMHQLQPSDWGEMKVKMWPYREKIKILEEQKVTLEKSLSVLQTPSRGHEHKGSNLNGQSIKLLSAGGISIQGAKITANKQLDIQAAGLLPEPSADAKKDGTVQAAVNISGVFDTFEYGQHGTDKYAYAIFTRPTELSGKTGVTISAPNANDNSRIILSTTDISANNGKIGLQSYGDQIYAAGQDELYTYDKRSYKTGKWYNRKHITEIKEHKNAKSAPVRLSASQGIEIKSGSNIDAYATIFDAPRGSVKIEAGRKLTLYAVEDLNYDKLDSYKKRKFVGITYDKVHDTTTNSMRTALPSRVIAESANLQSGWDTKLQGTQFETTLGGAVIRAGVGAQARADAKIIFEGIKSSVHTETVSSSKSAFWRKQAGRGSSIETLKLPSFSGPVAPVLTAPGGYIANIPKGSLKTEIEKLAKQPEYAYLKQLQTAKNVDWKQVNLAYDKWDYKSEGMTPAAAAVVVIVVTVLTYGAMSGAAAAGTAGATGVGAGAGGAAAGTAAGTGAAAGSAAAGSSAAAVGAAAGKAALASLASQAAVALINNKGNLENTLKELGKSSTVKQIATAAVTAGVLQGIGGFNTEVAKAVSEQFGNPVAGKLTANLINTTAAAGVGTAINGGSLKDNLGNAALGALVTTAHGEIASKIKVNFSEDYVAHKIAHAVAGCAAAAAANQGKCRDGAIGAAVGEMVGEAMLGERDVNTLSANERQKIIGYSQIIAGSTVALVKGDVNMAANAAAVAVEKNVLNFASTSTNAKKHQPKQPDKSALEKLIQAIAPAHTAGAIVNPQDKDAALWISKIRNGITGPIVITSYGVYAAGWGTPLIGSAGKLAVTACMGNPSGCTVMVTQAAEAGAGLATGAVTVSNSWEGAVGSLAKAKAAKQAVSAQTVKKLDDLMYESQHIGAVNTRINIANNITRYTPMRQTGQPVSAGFEHVLEGHFYRPIANNRSIFTISPNELKDILQSNKVVSSSVHMTADGLYMRTVDVRRIIGTTSIKEGGKPTSVIKVFTDKAGNLITAYPVKGN